MDRGEAALRSWRVHGAPLAWATGTPSKRTGGGTLSSLNRDGGQRVKVDGRLYETIRDSHATKMYDGWGKFWR